MTSMISCASKQSGLDYYLAKEYAHSAAMYERVLEKKPEDQDAIMMRGWCYFKLGRYEEAKIEFENLQTLAPESEDAMEGLGWSLYMLGKYKKAVAFFDQLIQADLTSTTQVRTSDVEGLGYSYYKLKNYSAARYYLGYALEKNPKSQDNHVVMAYITMNMMDKKVSRYHFTKALEFQPDNTDALAGLQQLNTVKE